MGDFQRSPSKVWWGNDHISPHHRIIPAYQQHDAFLEEPEEVQAYQSPEINAFRDQEARTTTAHTSPTANGDLATDHNSSSPEWPSRNSSGSPNSHKSQDSGFSDSETSHNITAEADKCHNCGTGTPKSISRSLLKESACNGTPEKNINSLYKEKYSPKTSISKQLSNPLRPDETQRRNPPEVTHKPHMFSKSLQMYNVEPLLIYPNQNISSAPPSPTLHHINLHSSTPKSTTTENSNRNSNCYILEDNIIYQNRNTANKITYHRNNPTPNPTRSENAKHYKHSAPRKLSPKVSRNLFSCFPSNGNSVEDISKLNDADWAPQRLTDLNNGNTPDTRLSPRLSRTVPLFPAERSPLAEKRHNVTAPAGDEILYNPSDISFDDENDSCETPRKQDSIEIPSPGTIIELNESIVANPPAIDHFEIPVHHSTPKIITIPRKDTCLQKLILNNIKQTDSLRIAEPEKTPPATPPPVTKWMEELSKLYEAECMVTLQSKSLAAHLSRQVAAAAATATVTIKSLLAHTKIIYSDFYTILRQISCKKSDHLGPLIQSLNGNLTEFILSYIVNASAGSVAKNKQREHEVHEILEICDHLRQASATDCSYRELEQAILKLKSLFRETSRGILDIQIQLLVNMIEDPTTELALRGAVQGVMWLAAQQDSAVNSLLIRCGVPRALLAVCLESKASTLRAAALRAVATVCSTSDAIRQLEQAGGIEIIAEILSEDTRPEPELSEAVAVIAQITAPWIEDNHAVRGLKENGKSLVRSLTRLLNTTECCQILLLCAAALANISCMEPSTVWPLLQCHTAEVLLTAVQQRGPGVSIYLKEQTATLVANISAATESRLQLGEGKAVVALLCFLQVRPSVLDNAPNAEHTACMRLQQKSAIALSRLCNERSIAAQVVELGGVTQLVRLCKEKRERSHSDAVLVACLATLRKIASNCGNKVMEEQDAIELVEPRLLDSFLTYSAQNESYV